MNHWHVASLDLPPRAPRILSSTSDARAIALAIPAGGALPDHQVHERAWVVVLEGEVEIAVTGGEAVTGGPGLVVELAPGERHGVCAHADARLLLLLTPWPGAGRAGTAASTTPARRKPLPEGLAPDLRPRGAKGHQPAPHA